MFYSPSKNICYDPVLREKYEANGNWPDDAIEIPQELFDQVVSNRPTGKVMVPGTDGLPMLADPAPLTPGEIRAQYEADAQNLLDATAKSWGYDSIISAASYANSTVPQYKADAAALIQWRDQLWQAAYNVEVSVKNGQAMPATSADFLALLPSAPARSNV